MKKLIIILIYFSIVTVSKPTFSNTEIKCATQHENSNNRNFNVPVKYFKFTLPDSPSVENGFKYVDYMNSKNGIGTITFPSGWKLQDDGKLKYGNYIASSCDVISGRGSFFEYEDEKGVFLSFYKEMSKNLLKINKIANSSSSQKLKSNIKRKLNINSNKVSEINSKSSDTCILLQNKILKHIDNDEYQKASAARKLMKEMNCSSNSNTTSNNQSYTAPKKISKYSSSELSCSVGPLGKFMFREFGRYNVKAFDDNPPKACNQTYEYCKARARAIARGARIPSSERSPNSYSADCNITGRNRFNTTADCTVTPDRGGGGFAGGLANELGKGIERTAAMKRVYVSSFERCMTEMGYSVSGR